MHPMTSAEIDDRLRCPGRDVWRRPRDEVCVRPEHRAAARGAGRGSTEPVSFVFGGYLGFGGKVVIDDDGITVTAIDDTPQVHAVIKRANASLARVYSSLGTPTPASDRYQNGNVRFTGFHLARRDAWRLDLLSLGRLGHALRFIRSRPPGGHVDDVLARRERRQGDRLQRLDGLTLPANGRGATTRSRCRWMPLGLTSPGTRSQPAQASRRTTSRSWRGSVCCTARATGSTRGTSTASGSSTPSPGPASAPSPWPRPRPRAASRSPTTRSCTRTGARSPRGPTRTSGPAWGTARSSSRPCSRHSG